ncbi:MAG: T9SS type A sorting domain-containing protein [Chitinophagaceae bacterium]|nr:T9SS type A sorting domain-containing protein [Chitinophagaceae bacterium]
MKANGTLKTLVLFFIVLAVAGTQSKVLSQPDYDFRNPVLQSGTSNSIGAVYRFPNIKTGYDALVQITNMTNGVTLFRIDRTSDGFQEAFQPEIRVPASSNGYVEFQVTFVTTGTNTPATQSEIAVTPIDVDGGGGSGLLYEFDQINMGGGYLNYNLVYTELTFTYAGAAWYTGKNNTNIVYNGIDTVQQSVMFTVTNNNLSTFTVRVGADNQSNSLQTRLRSLYFKRFNFLGGLLADNGLFKFQAVRKQNTVDLYWELSAKANYKNVTVERANTAGQFSAIGNINISPSGNSAISGSFTDAAEVNGSVYYRLKLVSVNDKSSYSEVLVIKGKTANVKSFQVYPTVISSSANISIHSATRQQASFMVVDYSGKVIKQQNLNIAEGINSFHEGNFNNLPGGTYIAVLKTNDGVYNQKILVRN